MRSLTSRESRLLIITLLTVGVASIYIYIAEPRIQRAVALHGELAETRRELDSFERLLRDREKILANTESLEQQIDNTDDEEEELTSLLKEVERLSREARIESISLRPQRSREQSFYQLLGIQLTAEGGPQDVARFLHSVRESAQLLRVDSLTCNALKQPGRLRVNFTIVKILNPEDV